MPITQTWQNQKTVSYNRHDWMNCVVRNEELTKKELRVLLHLFTHLDHKNFKEISPKQIGKDLNIDKDDVKDAIQTLIRMEIIEQGSSPSVKNGYKTTF